MLARLIVYVTVLACLVAEANAFLMGRLKMPRYQSRVLMNSAEGSERADLRNVAIIAHVDHGISIHAIPFS